MAVPVKHITTQAEFEAFTARPENAERRFELVNEEIIEVPSNPYASEIAALVVFFIRLFLVQNKREGHVTGADGGYIVSGEIYAPDVAYISYERQSELAQKGYNPNPPELAVEVISDPGNSQEQTILRRKVANYLLAGTMVWIIDPLAETIEVYQIGQQPQFYTMGDNLVGGDVLPGFSLAVKDIFPKKKE
jgi:Uma2 family endonuclease